MPTALFWRTISKATTVVILQYPRKNGVQYDVSMRGVKMPSPSLDLFKIKLIDSLNFVPMRLTNFPKSFGLTELTEGYFPQGKSALLGPPRWSVLLWSQRIIQWLKHVFWMLQSSKTKPICIWFCSRDFNVLPFRWPFVLQDHRHHPFALAMRRRITCFFNHRSGKGDHCRHPSPRLHPKEKTIHPRTQVVVVHCRKTKHSHPTRLWWRTGTRGSLLFWRLSRRNPCRLWN